MTNDHEAPRIDDWLRRAASRLADAPAWRSGSDDVPGREASWLLAAVLGRDLAWLMTWPERRLSDAELARADDWLARRCAGEPLAYLRGEHEFWSLPLRVTPATLVPRPDTERLVEVVLSCLPPAARVLDLGTGSGAIALALAHERRDAEVTAVDRSAEALAVARGNGERLELPVRWLHGDWFAPVAGERFHVVASNPPYISDDDPHLAVLAHEPSTALVAADDGLADLRHLASTAPAHLLPGGWLLLEHGFAQAAAVRAALVAAGFTQVRSWQDLAGQDRVSGGCLPPDRLPPDRREVASDPGGCAPSASGERHAR
ncbi:UNVERIFIED_CONTAM: prmC [Trichonephila clavipes]